MLGALDGLCFLIMIVVFIAAWAWEAGYRAGKREGSRKAYGVGWERGRQAAQTGQSGCLVAFLAVALAVALLRVATA